MRVNNLQRTLGPVVTQHSGSGKANQYGRRGRQGRPLSSRRASSSPQSPFQRSRTVMSTIALHLEIGEP
jgi:hypothetical protein